MRDAIGEAGTNSRDISTTLITGIQHRWIYRLQLAKVRVVKRKVSQLDGNSGFFVSLVRAFTEFRSSRVNRHRKRNSIFFLFLFVVFFFLFSSSKGEHIDTHGRVSIGAARESALLTLRDCSEIQGTARRELSKIVACFWSFIAGLAPKSRSWLVFSSRWSSITGPPGHTQFSVDRYGSRLSVRFNLRRERSVVA